MRVIILAPVLISLIFLFVTGSHASEKVILVSSGQQVQVDISANQSPQKLKFALLSPGNKPLGLSIVGQAPKGALLTVETRAIPQKTSFEAALASDRALRTIPLAALGSGKRESNLTFGVAGVIDNGSWSSEGQYVCNGMLERKFLAYYTDLFTRVYQRAPSGTEELCDYLFNSEWRNQGSGGGGSSSSAPTNSELSAYGVLLKDLCSKNLSYLVIATIDLSKISQEFVTKGYSVNFSLSLDAYKGGIKMKLKRIGEGKFKSPLAIAEEMGSSLVSPEIHLMTRWKGGKITKEWRFPIRKRTPYRGLSLAVGTPGAALKGGKLSWYFTNYQSIYGVCVNAVARDQLFNGYRN